MKMFVSLFFTLVALQALANPVGVYYEPEQSEDEEGYSSPEKIIEVTSNAIKSEIVFNGAKIVESTPIRIQGDKIVIVLKPIPETVWDCQGEQVTFDAVTESGEYSISYKADAQGLTLDVPGEGSSKFARATAAQITRIRSLPACTRK